MDTKKCGKCGVVKSLSDFYRGISPCKACQAIKAKEYYARKPEVIAVRRTCTRCWRTKLVDAFGKSLTACKECLNVYHVEYREKNRERKRVESKERYKTHGHKRHAYSTKYRQEHRDELNARQREYAKQPDRVERERELRRLYCEKLTDAYVRKAITKGTSIKPEQVPQAMIETKRVQLQIKRRIKDGANTGGQGQKANTQNTG